MKIEFEYDNNLVDYLNNLMMNSLEDYVWNISETEAYDKYGNSIIFDSPVNASDLKNKFLSTSQLIFANLKGYKESSDNQIIDTYEDFKKSTCEIIILISDSSFVEIYAKNDDVLKRIEKNLKESNIPFEYKTERTDTRYRMSVE